MSNKDSAYLEYVIEYANCNEDFERSEVNKKYSWGGRSFYDRLDFNGRVNSNFFVVSKAHHNEVTRAPKTITLNGMEVVPPITDRLPEIGQKYWVYELDGDYDVCSYLFDNDRVDSKYIKNGWHDNKEDAIKFYEAQFKPYKLNKGLTNE